jgi:hypothetical protein
MHDDSLMTLEQVVDYNDRRANIAVESEKA